MSLSQDNGLQSPAYVSTLSRSQRTTTIGLLFLLVAKFDCSPCHTFKKVRSQAVPLRRVISCVVLLKEGMDATSLVQTNLIVIKINCLIPMSNVYRSHYRNFYLVPFTVDGIGSMNAVILAGPGSTGFK